MEKTSQAVSVTELKALLTAIIDNGRAICFRYRLVGELWQLHHMRVVVRVDDTVRLLNEVTNNTVTIQLQDIMQFEIDGSIYGYKPHNHYNVSPF
jgi:hypothetical protein